MSRKRRKESKGIMDGIAPDALNIEIDYEKLVTTIIKAHKQLDDIHANEQAEEERKKRKEWHDTLNYKEYPENEGIVKSWMHDVRNNICILKSLLFFKKGNAKDLHSTLALLQVAVMAVLGIGKVILYCLAVYCVYRAFTANEILISVWLIGGAFILGVFGRMFRIAVFEIENMKDGNALIALFSVCISIISLIIAIISLRI